jgi:hypothetical protein
MRFSTPIKLDTCKKCSRLATRFFAEDFPDVGRTVFLGNYCAHHEPDQEKK